MADTRTRIINLPEATTLDSSMNFVEDSADGSGTRRVTYDTLKGAINQDSATNLAPAYSNAATYAVGDLCTYQGMLYSCNTAISTAEDWTAAHWTAVNVSAEISELESDLENNTISPEWMSGKYISNSDGSEISYASWSCTGYIAVNSETVQILMSEALVSVGYGSKYNAFYDSNHVFVSSFMFNQKVSNIAVPSNAKYMRLSVETRYRTGIKLYTQLLYSVKKHDESIDDLSGVEIPLKIFMNEYINQRGIVTS